jgi:hypothetical protein
MIRLGLLQIQNFMTTGEFYIAQRSVFNVPAAIYDKKISLNIKDYRKIIAIP